MKATIIVSGKVQRVGYRNFVRIAAKIHQVKGLVRNLENGNVEIFMNCEGQNPPGFIESLEKTSGLCPAKVDRVNVYEEGHEKYNGPWRDYLDKFLIDRRKVQNFENCGN